LWRDRISKGEWGEADDWFVGKVLLDKTNFRIYNKVIEKSAEGIRVVISNRGQLIIDAS